MMRRILAGVAAVALTGAQPSVAAQTPQGTPPPDTKQPTAPRRETPVLRTTTRLVQVSVVAQDKHGEPATDLAKEDFRVFDRGAEQKIEFFSMEAQRLLPAEGPALPKDTWTNRLRQREGIPASVTLILLDGLNTQYQDQSYAHEQLVRFLSQLRPEEHVALYTLGSDLRILHDFTRDATSLLRALSREKGYNGPRVPEEEPDTGVKDSGIAALDDLLRTANAAITQNTYIHRAYRTVDALEAIAMHVAAIPGRKNLIWLSGGFPISVGYEGLPVRGGPQEQTIGNFGNCWSGRRGR